MLRCILKNIPNIVMKKYFQIMPLMSKLFLNSGYKSLKMNIAFFFTHYIDSKFL